jgi:CPA1 family monovalent cation:H+ antiporter
VGAAARVIVGWAGMRGAVSLAAALSLPPETDAGDALPGRDLILFVTFALILFTVVVQGLTLPALIRRLGVGIEQSEDEKEEAKARYAAAVAGIGRIDELESETWTNQDTIDRARGLRQFRIRRLKVRLGKAEDEDGVEERSLAYQRLMREIYVAERAALVELRNRGDVSAEVMGRVLRELDLEESRLEI